MLVALMIFGYLVGSIPWSFLIGKARGVDLRKVGSGNTGASNVWRNLGFKPFLLAFGLDLAKGTLPTWIAYRVAHQSPTATIVVGVCAMLGHIFPLFLGFRGGKAVATLAGVLLALEPWLIVVAAVVWISAYKLKGYPSLSSLLATFATAIAATFLAMQDRMPQEFAAFVWVALIVVIYMHRANIQRLLKGQEMGIGPRTK